MKLNDIFWTFQGEGANWGRRALFVRMPFCNLHCEWCDTSFNSFKKWTDEAFLEFANQEQCRFAVITGGEPSINKDTPKVITLLKQAGFYLAIETNGTFPVPYGIDFITVSPKSDADYHVDEDTWRRADEFKYVVDEGFDFAVLDKHDTENGKRYSLSPEFGNWEKSLARIYEYIKEHPQWRISLQTHKWLGIP